TLCLPPLRRGGSGGSTPVAVVNSPKRNRIHGWTSSIHATDRQLFISPVQHSAPPRFDSSRLRDRPRHGCLTTSNSDFHQEEDQFPDAKRRPRSPCSANPSSVRLTRPIAKPRSGITGSRPERASRSSPGQPARRRRVLGASSGSR